MSYSFPRSAWECRLRRSASSSDFQGPSVFGVVPDAPAQVEACAGPTAPNRERPNRQWRGSVPEDDAERRGRHSHAERGNECYLSS